MKAWLSEFLFIRECFAGPTGKPLYSYHVTFEEFQSLKNKLIANIRFATDPIKGKHWAELYCLFVAERFRRDYGAEEGSWSWEWADKSLGCDFKQGLRSELISYGLESFWKRPIRRTEKGRNFIGSLFLEGGLPWPLIKSETHGFGRVIRKGLKNYHSNKASLGTTSDMVITEELNGPVSSVSDRISKLFESYAKEFSDLLKTDQVRSIVYSDRYLKSPWSAVLLSGFIELLSGDELESVEIRTLRPKVNAAYPSREIKHDWIRDSDLTNCIEMLFSGAFGITPTVQLFDKTYDLQHDVWVWRAASLVLCKEILEHIVPVFRGKVDGVQLDTNLIAHGLRIGQINGGRAILSSIVFLPVFHKQTFNLIALFKQ